jgi:uncharacterized protein YecE (DUF72 family)
MAGTIHIGTSGWSYSHWMGSFYPFDIKQKDRFAYFQQHLDTVELNSPFYKLPPKKTFEKWRNDVPDGFIYSVKANRYITHLKKLHDVSETLTEMLDNASALEDKLGVMLFQLPPGWHANVDRFEEFLQLLPKGGRYTFEFRNSTWYIDEVYYLLEKYNCAFCIYELAGHVSPLKTTANYVYVRLHGPGDKYQGKYSDRILEQWAGRCKTWAAEGKDVYVYFDNDEKAYAAHNAITLKGMVGAGQL